MEDSVDETEAVKRYNQYKLDFRRQQLQDFFLQHKDQEWFRSKYHPDDIATRKTESLAALKTRLSVFLFLLDNNWLDNVSLDMDHSPAIIKLLDAGKETWVVRLDNKPNEKTEQRDRIKIVCFPIRYQKLLNVQYEKLKKALMVMGLCKLC